jgi:hypothetical protein
MCVKLYPHVLGVKGSSPGTVTVNVHGWHVASQRFACL